MGQLNLNKPFSHIIKEYAYNDTIGSETSCFLLQFCDGTKIGLTHNAAIAMRKFAGVECREWDDNNRPFNSPTLLTTTQVEHCKRYRKERQEKETTPVEDVVRYVWN